jgi:hypothetical protein
MQSDSAVQDEIGSSTPILDCLQPLPAVKSVFGGRNLSKKEIVGVFLLLFGMVAFVALGMNFSPTLYRILDDPWGALTQTNTPTGGPIVLFILFSAFYLAIAIHELGHLCAGWIAGFEFNTISVGPLLLFRAGKRPKIRLQRSFLGGRVTMFPRSLDHLRRRFLIFIAGGPLASFAGSACFVFLSPGSATELFVTLFASISLIQGLANLFPFEVNDLVSDGGRIRTLLSRDGKKERWFALTAIEDALRKLQNIEEWPSVFIQAATTINDHSTDCFRASYYAFVWASSLDRTEDAARFLERSLETCDKAPVLLRKIVFCEAAIFQAWQRKNADRMREWLGRLGGGLKVPLMDLRLQIARLWVEGKTNESIAKWQEGLTLIRATKDDKQRNFLEKSWMEWRCKIDEKMAARQPTS